MKILHIDLVLVSDTDAEVRYFWDNPNDYQSYQLPFTEIEISTLIRLSQLGCYYTRLPEDYDKIGQILYRWLDGNNRILENLINQYPRKGIILAIAASEYLANLPWEILHNGEKFLVEFRPAIIPIRWVKDGNNKSLIFKEEPANRALNVLFMASSPRGIEAELDFEAEEAKILEATKRQPLCLTVEESGCLQELGYWLKNYDRNHFDVIHLTGYATIEDKKPCFITETEFGGAEYSSAEDIADEIQFQCPPLIFLSGFLTGYLGNEGVICSLAEELLRQGARAVLAWGDRVLDAQAATAASLLYQELSMGMTVMEALACTYQALLKIPSCENLQQGIRNDWYLLRLYIAETIPGALVRRNASKPAPRSSITFRFLDTEGKVRVATRETFVGRRRQLQNCLRNLKIDPDKIGVLIYGFGGLGKSTIAARLCDRFPAAQTEIVVWWRQIDKSSVIKQLADKLSNYKDLRQNLQDSEEELRYRLVNLWAELGERNKQFLLVFDDFEWNLEPRQGQYVLKPEVVQVFSALIRAIEETQTRHRVIVTCRYDFESDLLNSFHKEPLDSFRKSDLQKKLNRLPAFNSKQVDDKLIERAKSLTDGNPRLLKWLNDEVLLKEDAKAKLSQLEASADDWKGQIVREELYQQIDAPLEQALSHCLIFEIPVPLAALEAVCDSIPSYEEQLSRAIKLGLIEVTPETIDSRQYHVSRILPHLIPEIKLTQTSCVYSLYRKASEKLYELWGRPENQNQEQWQEIFRLILADKENQSRFRQSFYKMLEVRYNFEAGRAYENELRKVADELIEENLYSQLKAYLQQRQWREADAETAWIFYQIMVKENHEDWYELLKKIPCEKLKNINQLWLRYSSEKFGFSLQIETYQSLGGTDKYNEEVWQKFGERVGWKKGEKWLMYDEVMNQNNVSLDSGTISTLPISMPTLPTLIYTRGGSSWGVVGWRWMVGSLFSLAHRFVTCK